MVILRRYSIHFPTIKYVNFSISYLQRVCKSNFPFPLFVLEQCVRLKQDSAEHRAHQPQGQPDLHSGSYWRTVSPARVVSEGIHATLKESMLIKLTVVWSQRFVKETFIKLTVVKLTNFFCKV